MVDKRTPSPRGNVLAIDTTEPALASRRNLFQFGKRLYSSKRILTSGRWRGHKCWGNNRGGGQARGRLTPEVNVTIGGDRPTTFFCGLVAFEDERQYFVACFGV